MDDERISLIGALEAEGLLVTEWWDDALASYPPHTHPYREVRVVLAGSMTITVGDEVRELGPGDRIDLGPGAEHGAVVGPDGVHYLAGSDRENRSDVVRPTDTLRT
jgi:quercetin dioxygenase-like cupin family protein